MAPEYGGVSNEPFLEEANGRNLTVQLWRNCGERVAFVRKKKAKDF
jgi:hypothetical protein